MTRRRWNADRGLPDPELWEAPHRLSEREMAADWGVDGAAWPRGEQEDDR